MDYTVFSTEFPDVKLYNEPLKKLYIYKTVVAVLPSDYFQR